MRHSSLILAVLAASVGYAVARARPAAAVVDEHANHAERSPTTITLTAEQAANLPASGATAAERLAKSPRHGEWVAV